MLSPREALGKYIKDKLISIGALEFGEAVSEDTLLDYGNDRLRFKKLMETGFMLNFKLSTK